MLFAPQARSCPVEISARAWPQPATTETRCPNGPPCCEPTCCGPMLTGVSLSVVVMPSPSCPRLSAPQAYAPPPEVLAKAKLNPADRIRTLLPLGSLTRTGVSLLTVLPLPNSPRLLSPQASA